MKKRGFLLFFLLAVIAGVVIPQESFPGTQGQDLSPALIREYTYIRKAPVLREEDGRVTFDFETSGNEDEKLKTVFNNSPTVTCTMGGQTFLRIDGLLGNPRELGEYQG